MIWSQFVICAGGDRTGLLPILPIYPWNGLSHFAHSIASPRRCLNLHGVAPNIFEWTFDCTSEGVVSNNKVMEAPAFSPQRIRATRRTYGDS
jgi:hypothetical protein